MVGEINIIYIPNVHQTKCGLVRNFVYEKIS